MSDLTVDEVLRLSNEARQGGRQYPAQQVAALADFCLTLYEEWLKDQDALAAKNAENERLREALKSAFDTFGDILERIADVPASEWPFDPVQEPAAARRLVDAADDVEILTLDALDALHAVLADGEAEGRG